MLWKLFFYKGSFLQALCQGKPLAKAFCWPKPFCQPNILLPSGPFAKGVPARRFLFVKGICQDPLVKVCLVGKELTLLSRKDFVSRMSKGMPFGQDISMLGSQCTLSNPSLTSWRCRSIDFGAQPCRLDSMHHTGSQSAHPAHKIFWPKVPATPGVDITGALDYVTTGVKLHGDVEQISVSFFCPLIQPGVAGKELPG